MLLRSDMCLVCSFVDAMRCGRCAGLGRQMTLPCADSSLETPPRTKKTLPGEVLLAANCTVCACLPAAWPALEPPQKVVFASATVMPASVGRSGCTAVVTGHSGSNPRRQRRRRGERCGPGTSACTQFSVLSECTFDFENLDLDGP